MKDITKGILIGAGAAILTQIVLYVSGSLSSSVGSGMDAINELLDSDFVQARVATVDVNGAFGRSETRNIPFRWPTRPSEPKFAPKAAFIGDIEGGAFAELVVSVTQVTSDGGVVYVHNPENRVWPVKNFKVKVVGIYFEE